jgi:hypothetical protein
MASEQHLAILKSGAQAWNEWRQAEPLVRPDLEGLSLSLAEKQWGETSGGAINLARALLRDANLRYATLIRCNLSAANLDGANLSGARLQDADLRNASLIKARFDEADLTNARLEGADISGADLSTARNLTLKQVAGAIGDYATVLPASIPMPPSWRTGVREAQIEDNLAPFPRGPNAPALKKLTDPAGTGAGAADKTGAAVAAEDAASPLQSDNEAPKSRWSENLARAQPVPDAREREDKHSAKGAGLGRPSGDGTPSRRHGRSLAVATGAVCLAVVSFAALQHAARPRHHEAATSSENAPLSDEETLGGATEPPAWLGIGGPQAPGQEIGDDGRRPALKLYGKREEKAPPGAPGRIAPETPEQSRELTYSVLLKDIAPDEAVKAVDVREEVGALSEESQEASGD